MDSRLFVILYFSTKIHVRNQPFSCSHKNHVTKPCKQIFFTKNLDHKVVHKNDASDFHTKIQPMDANIFPHKIWIMEHSMILFSFPNTKKCISEQPMRPMQNLIKLWKCQCILANTQQFGRYRKFVINNDVNCKIALFGEYFFYKVKQSCEKFVVLHFKCTKIKC